MSSMNSMCGNAYTIDFDFEYWFDYPLQGA